MSEGPKNERTKLSEQLEPPTEQSSETAERGNCGHDSADQASPRRYRRLNGCERDGEGGGSARLNTESNVRGTDGRGRHEGKRQGSLASAQTQRRLAGDRPNDDRATGCPARSSAWRFPSPTEEPGCWASRRWWTGGYSKCFCRCCKPSLTPPSVSTATDSDP